MKNSDNEALKTFEYVTNTNQLTTAEAQPVKKELLRRWGGRLELAVIG